MISYNLFNIYHRHTFKPICLFLIFLNVSIVHSDNDSEVLISADKIEVINNGNVIIGTGNILIETEQIISTSDRINYNKDKELLRSSGNIIAKDSLDNNYFFDDLISDKNFNNAIGLSPKIKLKDGTRITGKLFTRTNSSINQIDNAAYTPCLQKNYTFKKCPGWKLNAKKVIHDVENQNIYYENAVLSILNLPILYTPFFSHPDPTVNKRSGILAPTISSDNVLGTSLSIPLFYNLKSNYDLTFTPTIQSKADDYYTINYRQLSKNYTANIETSMSRDESNTGTKNHFFLDGDIKNSYGKLNYQIQTSNNDTYLRKNNINQEIVLSSGIDFTKKMENSHLSLNANIYKHLNNSPDKKWEYIYPNIKYDIYEYKDPVSSLNWRIENSLLNYRDINRNYNQELSSELSSEKIITSRSTGLRFKNTFQNRFMYFNDSANDLSQLRIFPQFASKISYPLSKITTTGSQSLEPMIIPILAPYNNYSSNQIINNSNIFSLNRETTLSKSEGGPRIIYGADWLISSKKYAIISTIGQSLRVNKESSDNSEEISDYIFGSTIDFGENGYIATDITIERKDLYLKNNNTNAFLELEKIKFGFNYDYETKNKIRTSEQISVEAKIDLVKDTDFIMSVRKDLMTEKSIGNSFGVRYENDCLAINLDYFRDFTAIDDIKNSRGFSFTITLKPFGTSKQAGRVKNFGPGFLDEK